MLIWKELEGRGGESVYVCAEKKEERRDERWIRNERGEKEEGER